MVTRVIVLLSLAAGLYSAVYTPRILINKQSDYSSIESIVNSIIEPDMTSHEKAEAVWRFLLQSMFHYKAPSEGPAIFELYTVQDPLKLLNSYGYTYCFASVGMTTTLWKAAGFDSVRIWGFPGHLVSEVYYDNDWHYFDADQSVSAYFCKKGSNVVASINDIRENPEGYISAPPFCSSPNMPYDTNPVYEHESRKVLVGMFSKRDKHNTRDWVAINTHNMDFYLKKYESLTLFFSPKGKWRHHGMDVPQINSVNGPYDAHSDRKYGNGLFEYFPDFSDKSIIENDFYSSSNISLSNGKLSLTDQNSPGEFTIKCLSPYVITGTPMNPSQSVANSKFQEYYGAVTLSGQVRALDTSFTRPIELELMISTDKMHGIFETAYTQSSSGFFSIDLSRWFNKPVYYYLIKIKIRKSDKNIYPPIIDSLRLRTWVQVNPASLPKLEPGNNEIRYSMNRNITDKHESVKYVDSTTIDSIAFALNNAVYGNRFHRRILQENQETPGEAYFLMKSDNGPIHEYAVSTILGLRSNMTSKLFISEGDTLNWKEFPVPEKKFNDHWKHPVTVKGRTTKPVTEVYFKVMINGGATIANFDYTYRVAAKKPSGTVTVTQGYTADGKPKEHVWKFEGDSGKTNVKIKGKKITNTFIKYSVN